MTLFLVLIEELADSRDGVLTLEEATHANLSSLGHDVVDVRPDVFDVGDDYPPSCIETARRAVAGLGRIGG